VRSVIPYWSNKGSICVQWTYTDFSCSRLSDCDVIVPSIILVDDIRVSQAFLEVYKASELFSVCHGWELL
jgi:hypothetical protein